MPVDALVRTGDTGGLVLYLALDVGEICELATRDVVKFCPLGSASGMRRVVGICGWIWSIFVVRYVDELENEGAPSDDTAAAWEEVPANDVFEDGRLAGGLRTNNNLKNGQYDR